MTKKRKKGADLHDLSFQEALGRFLNTDPKELEEEIERVKRKQEAAEQYVEERKKSIRKGARRANKKFRL